MIKLKHIILTILLMLTHILSGQDEEVDKKNSISISIAHTHIGNGVVNGRRKAIILPAWGINYDRRLKERWAIGIHTDMVIEEFELETQDDQNLMVTKKRTRPLSTAITASYEISHFLVATFGVGREFSPEEDYNLFRIGLEPFFELPNDFEFIGTLTIDFRLEAYNALTFGLGVLKRF